MSSLSTNFLKFGFVASALGLLAGGQVFGQSKPATSNCRCEHALRTDPGSLDQALLAYTEALTKGDRSTISKYSGRFTIGLHRRRAYRTQVEQAKIIDQLISV